MARAKKQDETKEEIKHALEELWGLTPEEIPCKIFSREARLAIDEVYFLSKEEMHEISHKIEDSNACI